MSSSAPRYRFFPDDAPDPAQMALFRRMTPAEKFAVADRMTIEAIQLKRSYERGRNPEKSDEEIDAIVRRWVTRGSG